MIGGLSYFRRRVTRPHQLDHSLTNKRYCIQFSLLLWFQLLVAFSCHRLWFWASPDGLNCLRSYPVPVRETWI